MFRIYNCFFCLLVSSLTLIGQVPVKEEPFHRPVLENKYFRLLDVWLKPGDTTLFHIHATPSLFLYLSNTNLATQVQGKEWAHEKTTAGFSWYRSFTPEVLIHRVANIDSVPLHVTDIEILSRYNNSTPLDKSGLSISILYENEKAFVYQLKNLKGISPTIHDRGPMIAEIVKGDSVYFKDARNRINIPIPAGGFLYIEPGIPFNFINMGREMELVLFELK